MLRRLGVLWCLFVLVAAAAAAQTAIASDQLAWDQDAPSLAVANAYVAEAEVDGAAPVVLAGMRCMGTASPFLCVASLPAVTPGRHAIRVRVTETVDDVTLMSEWSAPFEFLMRAVPATPRNPRLTR